MIEAFAAAKEGIGHVLGPDLRREIEEAADLVARRSRGELDELLVVLAVHGEEKIDARVIGDRDLTRALA